MSRRAKSNAANVPSTVPTGERLDSCPVPRVPEGEDRPTLRVPMILAADGKRPCTIDGLADQEPAEHSMPVTTNASHISRRPTRRPSQRPTARPPEAYYRSIGITRRYGEERIAALLRELELELEGK